jgi:pyruvate formate lyase activating enzyme
MRDHYFLKDFEKCELCEHRCKVNRLEGETGVCKMTLPVVASATLHPAPPESYTVFMAGCNFKCLHCQNWTISQYPDNRCKQRGYVEPSDLAEECIQQLSSIYGKTMRADRIFFSGGEPTINLPHIEKVVADARKIKPETKVNFDTNGYMTEKSLQRILNFTTSITFDLKAYQNETHLALTGAYAAPILRNAEFIASNDRNKIWEYRIVAIPKINEVEIRPLAEFIASIDPALPVCFLAFRPNFVFENHPGATLGLMDRCVEIAEQSGLKNAYWSGHAGIRGTIADIDFEVKQSYRSEEAQLAGSYALDAGCRTHPRNCSVCLSNLECKLKRYIPQKST